MALARLRRSSCTGPAPGLVLRSVGESPQSAHALGYRVRRIRLAAVMAGGALCGVAGAFLSVVYTPLWVEGMVAGRGWIALALTVFATWRPARILLGAYLFGGVTMLQLHLQAQGVKCRSQFMAMLPYVATIVVLVLISRNRAGSGSTCPPRSGSRSSRAPEQHDGAPHRGHCPPRRGDIHEYVPSPASSRSAPSSLAGDARRLRQEGRAARRRRCRRAGPRRQGRAAQGRLHLRRPGRRRRLELLARPRPQATRSRSSATRSRPPSSRRCPRAPTPSASSATSWRRATR